MLFFFLLLVAIILLTYSLHGMRLRRFLIHVMDEMVVQNMKGDGDTRCHSCYTKWTKDSIADGMRQMKFEREERSWLTFWEFVF